MKDKSLIDADEFSPKPDCESTRGNDKYTNENQNLKVKFKVLADEYKQSLQERIQIDDLLRQEFQLEDVISYKTLLEAIMAFKKSHLDKSSSIVAENSDLQRRLNLEAEANTLHNSAKTDLVEKFEHLLLEKSKVIEQLQSQMSSSCASLQEEKQSLLALLHEKDNLIAQFENEKLEKSIVVKNDNDNEDAERKYLECLKTMEERGTEYSQWIEVLEGENNNLREEVEKLRQTYNHDLETLQLQLRSFEDQFGALSKEMESISLDDLIPVEFVNRVMSVIHLSNNDEKNGLCKEKITLLNKNDFPNNHMSAENAMQIIQEEITLYKALHMTVKSNEFENMTLDQMQNSNTDHYDKLRNENVALDMRCEQLCLEVANLNKKIADMNNTDVQEKIMRHEELQIENKKLTEKINILEECNKNMEEKLSLNFLHAEQQSKNLNSQLDSFQRTAAKEKEDFQKEIGDLKNALFDMDVRTKEFNEEREKKRHKELLEKESQIDDLEREFDAVKQENSILRAQQEKYLRENQSREAELLVMKNSMKEEMQNLEELKKLNESVLQADYIKNLILKYMTEEDKRDQLTSVLTRALNFSGEEMVQIQEKRAQTTSKGILGYLPFS